MELQLYLQGYSYQQIAEKTNQPVGLVKSIVYKQRKAAQKQEQ